MADMFQKVSIFDIATELDVHPFTVARLYGIQGGLPRDLRFDAKSIEKARKDLALEVYWDGSPMGVVDDHASRRLVREFAHRLLAWDFSTFTRADNLYRGLQGADKLLIRGVRNELIRMRILGSFPSATGLMVKLNPDKREELDKIAEGVDIPSSIERLWT